MAKKMRSWILSVNFILCAAYLIGCAGTEFIAPSKPQGIPGIYHRVQKSQTLWRISRMYNVDLGELVRINRIPNATNIEIGQLIFIPNRQKELSYLTPKKDAGGDDFIWPLKGKVTSVFGQTFNDMVNKGINIKPYNISNIVAARSGKVIFCNTAFKNFGGTLIIDHTDGFLTVYSGNLELLVRSGDQVSKGNLIAKVDSGPKEQDRYLHFEIRKGHIPQNPYFYLP